MKSNLPPKDVISVIMLFNNSKEFLSFNKPSESKKEIKYSRQKSISLFLVKAGLYYSIELY